MSWFNRYFYGSWGSDIIEANDFNNVIFGFGENDALFGFGGNDLIFGGSGNDFIDGGSGNDKLYGGWGNDTIHGGTGNDLLYGGSGQDQLFGEDGHDYISGSWGNDTVYGGAGNDYITGGSGNDFIDVGAGSDRAWGGRGNDTLRFVSSENDGVYNRLDGGRHIDTLELHLTAEQFIDDFVAEELLAYVDYIQSNLRGNGEFRGPDFHFDTLNLRVDDFEIFRVFVDGVEVDVNDAGGVDLVAIDDSFSLSENDILADDVTSNDTLSDGTTVTLLTGVTQGTLVLNADGSFTFDPGSDFDGLAVSETAELSFTYQISNGSDTQTATTTITVTGANDAPVVSAVIADAIEGGPSITITANASDVDSSDELTFSINTDDTLGFVTNNGDGTFSYAAGGEFRELGVGQTAIDTFTYTVNDGNGGTATETVTITITGQNDEPFVEGVVSQTASEDDAAFTLDLLDGSSDIDGDSLSVANLTLLSGDDSGITLSDDGLTIDVDPSAYTALGAGDAAVITYTYDVIDGNGGSVPQQATIEITGANDGPVITTAMGGNEGAVTEARDLTPLPTGMDIMVNTTTAGIQNNASIAALADGGFVVTFTDRSGADGSIWGIFGQRYDATGVAVGAEFQVNTTTADLQSDSSVTGLADGGFVVTFTDQSGADGSRDGVFGQRYDAMGVAVGAEFLVNTTTARSQDLSRVTALSDGGFVVIFENEFDIFGQRFDAMGEAVGAEFQVNTMTPGSKFDSSVTALADGGFVVTYGDSVGLDGSFTGIFGQRFDAMGAAVGAEFQVNTTTAFFQDDSSVTGLADGGFVVTFTDGSGILGQRFDAMGVAVGPEFQVNTTTASRVVNSSVTGLADGGFVVTFTVNFGLAGGSGVFGQRYDAMGVAVGDEFLINDTTLGNQFSASIVELADGRLAVSFIGSGGDGGETDVFVRIIDTPVADPTTSPATGVITADDVDAGAVLTFSGDAAGIYGAFVIDAATGEWSYTLDNSDPDTDALPEGQIVTETFTVTVTDDQGAMATQDVTITITGTNDAPVAVALTGEANEDGPSITIEADFTDVDATDTHTFSVDTTGTLGSVTDNGDGTFGYDANGAFESLAVGETATDTFSYTVDDGNGGTSTETVTITIAGANDGPVITTAIGGNEGAITEDSTDNLTPLPTGADILVNTTTASIQNEASIAALADGGFVVTFTDRSGADGSSWGVFGQRFDAMGVAVGNQFQVNTTTADSQFGSSVTALADGGFVVTFTDESGADGDSRGIFGQRYDAMGAALGAEFQVNTTIASTQTRSNVTALADGGFVVTFTDFSGADGSIGGVFGQRYDAMGAAVGAEFQVNTTTASSQDSSQVTALADGGFVVTFSDFSGADGNSVGVFGQRFDATGAPVGDEFQVNTTTASLQSEPSVTALADGGFVITFTDFSGADGDSRGIFGQRYDAMGVALGAEFQVNTTTAGIQSQSSVTALADGGFVVTFSDFSGTDGNSAGVLGQRFDAMGVAVGAEFLINDTITGAQSVSSIVELADGRLAVTFNSAESISSGDVFVRIIDMPAAGPAINSAAGAITADDVDTGAVLTFSGDAAGIYGAFAIDTATGEWTYTLDEPDALSEGQIVTEVFTVTVTDDQGATVTQDVTITVTGTNDAPTTNDTRVFFDSDGNATITLETIPDNVDELDVGVSEDVITVLPSFIFGNSFDVDGDTLSFTVSATSENGALVTLNPDGTVSYDPTLAATLQDLDAGERLVDSFTYTADDGNGGSVTGTIFIAVNGVTDPVFGTEDGETITGTANDDIIFGAPEGTVLDQDGNDTIDGLGGDDVITVQNGGNTITGGDGNDTITVTTLPFNFRGAQNIVNGGAGDDIIFNGLFSNDMIDGGEGNDVFRLTGNGTYTVIGGAGNDTFSATHAREGSGSFTLSGGEGDDVFSFNADERYIVDGGVGNDRFSGSFDTNSEGSVISGGEGDDVFDFSLLDGVNVNGDAGNDIINVRNSRIEAQVSGGEGNDSISYGGDDGQLFGDAGNDTIVIAGNNTDAFGGTGNDVINFDGRSFGSTAQGGEGDDIFNFISYFGGQAVGGDGADIFNVGQGSDAVASGGAGDDVFNVLFRADDFVLNGGDGNDVFDITANREVGTIIGGAGDDLFIFGNFNNRLVMTGGEGRDTFRVETETLRNTFITDFEDGMDMLDLSSLNYDANDLADLLAASSMSGTSIIIDFGNGGQLTLNNFDIADLSIDDFIL